MERWFSHKDHGYGQVHRTLGTDAIVRFRGMDDLTRVPWDELLDVPKPVVESLTVGGILPRAPRMAPKASMLSARLGIKALVESRRPRDKEIGRETATEGLHTLSCQMWQNVVQPSTNGTSIRHRTIPLEPSWTKIEDDGRSYLNKNYDPRTEFDEAGDFDHELLNAQEGDTRAAHELNYRPSPEEQLNAEIDRSALVHTSSPVMTDKERATKRAALDKRMGDMITVLNVRMENEVPWDKIAGVLGWPQLYVRALSQDIGRLLGPELFKRKPPAVRTLRGRFAPKDYSVDQDTLISAVRRYVKWMRKKDKFPGWRFPGWKR